MNIRVFSIKLRRIEIRPFKKNNLMVIFFNDESCDCITYSVRYLSLYYILKFSHVKEH